MELICPDSLCQNHSPDPTVRWFDYHGSYFSCGQPIRRFRCRACRRTFSERTLSIDYWTHSHLDYQLLINLYVSGCSLRALSRLFDTTVKTIQNRFSRLARTVIPTLSLIQGKIDLNDSPTD